MPQAILSWICIYILPKLGRSILLHVNVPVKFMKRQPTKTNNNKKKLKNSITSFMAGVAESFMV